MRRGFKWLVRGTLVLAGLSVLLLVAYVAVLPGFVEARAVAALQDLGLPDVRLQVRRLSPSGADLARISAGDDGRLRIDHVRVDYDWRELLRGRINLVEVLGLEFEARLDDGELDLGPLDALSGGDDGGDGDGGIPELPFDRLVLRSALLRVVVDGRPVAVPFDATIDARGTDLAVDLSARTDVGDLHAAGTIHLRTGDADLLVNGEVAELASALPLLPEELRRQAGRPNGGIAFAVRLRRESGVTRLEGNAHADSLAWSGQLDGTSATLEGVTLELTGLRGRHAGNSSPTLEGFDLVLRGATIDVAGAPPVQGSIHARFADPETVRVEVVTRLRGDAADRLTIDARATGLLGGADPVRVTGTIEGAVGWPSLIATVPALRELTEMIEPTSGSTMEISATVSAELDAAAGPDAWSAVASGRVGSHFARAALPGGAGTFRNARVDASFSGELDGGGATLRIEDDTRLVADALRVSDPAGGWSLEGAGDEVIAFRLREPLRIRAERGTAPPHWVVSRSGWSAHARGLTFSHVTSGARLDGVSVDVVGDIELDGGTATGRIHASSHFAVTDLAAPALTVERTSTATELLRLECTSPAHARVDLQADRSDWEVALPALSVRIAESDVLVEGGALRLENATFDWTLAALATPAGASITSEHPGILSVASCSGTAAGEPVTVGPLRLEFEPVRDELAYIGSDDERARIVAGVRTTARDLAITATAGTVTLDSVSLVVGASEGDAGVDVTGRLAATGSAATSADADAEAPDALSLRTGRLTVDVDAQGHGAGWSLGDLSWDAESRVESGAEGGPVTIEGSGAEVWIGSAVLESDVTVPAGGTPAVRGTLRLADVAGRHPSQRLDFSELTAEIPFSNVAEDGPPGRFDVGTIWWGDDLVPGFSGTLSMKESRVHVGLEWPVLDGVTATAAGWIDPIARIPEGELEFRVPRFVVTDSNQPADVFGRLDGARLGGAMELDGRIAIKGARVDPRITLTLDDVSVSSEAWDASAEGVNAAVTIDSFEPLSTPGNQTLSVRAAKLGRLEVKDGELAFRLEGARSLFIERTVWGWAGGQLYAHAIRFDPERPQLDVTVFADHLSLRELAVIVADGKFTGDGTFYGRLPVSLDWPKISYGSGFLYAEPGLGSLQVLDTGGIWQRIPAEARGALRDFEFAVLKANMIAGGEAKVRLRGKSRDPAFKRELILDMNVHGIDDLLDTAIIVSRVPTQLLDR